MHYKNKETKQTKLKFLEKITNEHVHTVPVLLKQSRVVCHQIQERDRIAQHHSIILSVQYLSEFVE